MSESNQDRVIRLKSGLVAANIHPHFDPTGSYRKHYAADVSRVPDRREMRELEVPK